jgi:hypothetical protein
MKSMILFITLTLFGSVVLAGEITGAGQAIEVLKAHNMSVSQLQQRGLKVLLGEITGAGKRLDLDRINMIVTGTKVLEMHQASHIEFKHPSQARSLKDVQHLEFNHIKVKVSQVKGIIYK